MIESRLVCATCSKVYEFDLLGKCSCGGTLLARYDLEAVKRAWSRESWAMRPGTMWRYRELLPVRRYGSIVTLGEGWTGLSELQPELLKMRIGRVRVKREETNPTGSFKARGISCAISLLNERGIRRVVVASNGNAGSALAAYASSAKMEAAVFLPADCPGVYVLECEGYGAATYLVRGWIHDAGAAAGRYQAERGSFNIGTLREPGRLEGKKTIGFEIAEQSGWKLPDAVVYPTGGGSGLVGMWKAFEELLQLGAVQGDMPRFYCVQMAGCDPVVQMLYSPESTKRFSPDLSVAHTGIRVPYPPDGPLLADIIRRTGGTAVSVSEQDMQDVRPLFAHTGIPASPESVAGWAGFVKLYEHHAFGANDDVVLFNTAYGDT